MIKYTESVNAITSEQLQGFFVDRKVKPSAQTHLKLLHQSDYVILAIDNDNVIGFITTITDDILSAYIPFLEVLPNYQRKGIGAELMKRMLARLKKLYMVDLICDPEMKTFYEHFDMKPLTGMVLRNINCIEKHETKRK